MKIVIEGVPPEARVRKLRKAVRGAVIALPGVYIPASAIEVGFGERDDSKRPYGFLRISVADHERIDPIHPLERAIADACIVFFKRRGLGYHGYETVPQIVEP